MNINHQYTKSKVFFNNLFFVFGIYNYTFVYVNVHTRSFPVLQLFSVTGTIYFLEIHANVQSKYIEALISQTVYTVYTDSF